MILHFSHIGLTDGRTFMIPFGWFQSTRLWLPGRLPLPRRGLHAQPEPNGSERDDEE
jgi:hypothetical protein